MLYRIVVIVAVLCAALAQMLLKQGAKQQYSTFWRQYLNGWVLSGYVIMGGAMLTNIFAMSRGVLLKEVSSIEALSYLFVPAFSWLFFAERITLKKALAIAVVMLGVVVFFM